MRLTEGLKKLTILVCQIILSTIVISVLVDVILRYAWKRGFLASGEFVPYLFTWIAFLGASIAVKDHEHLAVDMMLLASGKYKKVLETIIRIVELCFFISLVIYGWDMSMKTMVQRSPYLSLPYGIVYLSVPISGLLMAIYTIESLFLSLKKT